MYTTRKSKRPRVLWRWREKTGKNQRKMQLAHFASTGACTGHGKPLLMWLQLPFLSANLLLFAIFLHVNFTKYSNEWRCNTIFLGQSLAFIVIFDSLRSSVLESDPPKNYRVWLLSSCVGIHILNQSRFWLQASFTEEKRQCHEGV